MIIDPLYNYEAVNVESAVNLRSSFLNWLRHTIQIRQSHKAFSRGKVEFLDCSNKKVLTYLCRYKDDLALVVNNLSRFSQFVELDLAQYDGYEPVDLFGHTRFPRIGEMNYLLTWVRLVFTGSDW